MSDQHDLVPGEDDAPIRRRRSVSSPTAAGQEAEHRDLVTASAAAEMRHERQTISVGTTFGHPEDEFPHWVDIDHTVQEEFVARTSGKKDREALLRDDDIYHAMVNDVVLAHPEWGVQPVTLGRLVELLRAYQFGYGPIEDYMRIPELEEIYFNRFDEGFYRAGGRKHKIDPPVFRSADRMRAFLDRVAIENGIEVNLKNPILAASLKTGARLNATIEPIAFEGGVFNIRIHREIPFTIDQFIEQGYLTPELANDLAGWVRGRLNIIVSGGTGSGKTSFLNTIAKAYLPSSDRVIVIEGTKELQINTDDTVYLQTREDIIRASEHDISLEVLVKDALRMFPDRIIVGEIRGSEAYWALSAWNTGHEGSFCTIHANDAAAAVNRLEQLATSADELGEKAIQNLIADAVDLIIQIERDPVGGKRKVREVMQVLHPYKYDNLNPAMAQHVKTLAGNGQLRPLRDNMWGLMLYRADQSGRLQKLHNVVPLVGRS